MAYYKEYLQEVNQEGTAFLVNLYRKKIEKLVYISSIAALEVKQLDELMKIRRGIRQSKNTLCLLKIWC